MVKVASECVIFGDGVAGPSWSLPVPANYQALSYFQKDNTEPFGPLQAFSGLSHVVISPSTLFGNLHKCYELVLL